jgi:uncharacterized protein RhaS with RHS repeats
VTRFEYDASGRLTRTVRPAGDAIALTLDARGNVERVDHQPAGTGTARTLAKASYVTSCAAGPTCNKPLTSTNR